MAVYAGKAEFEQGGRSTLPTISCPECGVPTIARDDGFLCLDCVRATYDWRAPLEAHLKKHPKLLTLRRCTGCERVETTAANKKERRWERAERDTDELLAVLLRRVKAQLFGKKALDLVDGLSAGLKAGDPLALRDARLVWTEPHSRRLKLEVDVAHASVRQRLLLEFVEERCKCADCAGEARERRNRKMGKGGGDFGARVQIRAHGGSCARTMRSLEDAIRAIGKTGLAFGAARLPRGKGLDVDFAQEKDGDRFVDELRRAGRAPLRVASKTRKLLTHDPKANTVEYQKTILLEVPPISKWDLVVKEPRGGGGPALYLVSSVRREIRLDRVDGHGEEEVNGEQYFRKPFESVASADALVDVRVVDAASPLDDSSVLVARHEGDAPFQADASRLPLASRKPEAIIKAYDVESIVGADVKTSSRYVLVAPGGKRDVSDSTTAASTVLSRKQQRHAKRRANSSASVASDAPTERDFGEIEFRELLDQPDAIPEEGEELDLERLRIASEDSEALDAEFFGA
jgi:nonsense-mediated mRNA decay protein 3